MNEGRYQYEKPTRREQAVPVINEDMYRLLKSMDNLLRRRYPDDFERKVAATVIMREFSIANALDIV